MTHYCLARWDDTDGDEVDAHGRMPGWYPPQGTVGLFDMRPSSATEYGFFALDHKPTTDDWLGTDTPDLHVLNDGTDLREYHLTGAEKDQWRSLLNLTTSDMADSDVDTLEDALIWTFERCGAPDHQNRHKPPTATHDGFVEFHLGGHSLLSRRAFTDLPQTAQDRILAHVQNDMARIVEQGRQDVMPADHYRKMATMWARKYSLDTSKGKGQRGWHRLFPRQMRGNVEPPMEPETTITDDFTDADGTAIVDHTGNEGWSWYEDDGSGNHIQSNELASDSTGTGMFCYSGQSLSSDDHYSQCDVTYRGYTYSRAGAACRMDPPRSEAGSDYCYRCTLYKGDFYLTLNSESGKTQSPESPHTVTEDLPDTVKVSADGSTIRAYFNGSEMEAWSDTTVSGFLTTGVMIRNYGGTDDTRLDNFEAADLGAGGVTGSPADLAHTHSLGAPDVSQTHIISPNPLAHSHTIEQPTIAQTHVEAPADLSHGHTMGEPVIAQVHISTPQDLLHGHVLESPATGATITGSPADLAHGHSLAEPGITQTHIASPAELRHGHALGVPTVAVIYHGDPADLQHTHTIESIIQYIAGTLEGELEVTHPLSAGLSGEVKVIHILEADLEVE